MNPDKPQLPSYEVEFIPAERRLKDRRKRSASGFLGIERRRSRSRRDAEPPSKSH